MYRFDIDYAYFSQLLTSDGQWWQRAVTATGSDGNDGNGQWRRWAMTVMHWWQQIMMATTSDEVDEWLMNDGVDESGVQLVQCVVYRGKKNLNFRCRCSRHCRRHCCHEREVLPRHLINRTYHDIINTYQNRRSNRPCVWIIVAMIGWCWRNGKCQKTRWTAAWMDIVGSW